jgi:hypothetical protein
MADSKLEIKVPEDMIRTVIMGEVAKNLPNREQMIENVVKYALEQKAERYGDETIFQKAMKEMVNKEAQAAFQAWLDANRQMIKDALLKRMTQDKHRILKEVVEHLANAAKVTTPYINFKVE